MTLPSRRSDGRGGLEAGQQDQRPGADQVLQHTVQGGKINVSGPLRQPK
jgi:hypothetical protein